MRGIKKTYCLALVVAMIINIIFPVCAFAFALRTNPKAKAASRQSAKDVLFMDFTELEEGELPKGSIVSGTVTTAEYEVDGYKKNCLEILDTYHQQKDHHAGQDGELLGDRLKAGSLDHYLLHHDDEPLGRDDVGEHLKSDRHALAREYDAGQHHGRHCQSHTAQQHRCLLCLGED